MSNASLLRRLGAMLYDGLLVLALLLLGNVPFVALRGGESVDPYTATHQLTLLLITVVFFVGFWARYGRTLGMQSWGLQLEDETGAVPNLGRCCVRFVAALLSWAPAGLGFLWQLVDRDGLTWHDRLSGTRLRYYPRKKKKG